MQVLLRHACTTASASPITPGVHTHTRNDMHTHTHCGMSGYWHTGSYMYTLNACTHVLTCANTLRQCHLYLHVPSHMSEHTHSHTETQMHINTHTHLIQAPQTLWLMVLPAAPTLALGSTCPAQHSHQGPMDAVLDAHHQPWRGHLVAQVVT